MTGVNTDAAILAPINFTGIIHADKSGASYPDTRGAMAFNQAFNHSDRTTAGVNGVPPTAIVTAEDSGVVEQNIRSSHHRKAIAD
ncbi:hypothetical protein GTU79_14605 [Sodalis ligni]|uniref:hypothetical protein n=1 Tax=Sodalis ligni TaxID=2697027 RepID=UPI001BDE3E4F|nr:hypothetical protein [Sodalis ligni]QWA13682.1 hypothetical protein GTU79_14605 [Sodalis ligni]